MSEVKRRLTDIDFSKEGAHIALVDKAANGHEVLIIKGLHDDDEDDNGSSHTEVEVKMDVVNFLVTFFNLWHHEAATIAEIFGMDTDFFNEDFRFEEFNSLGASEVTLLKSASGIEKTEESLVAYVETLETEQLNTLKAYAEGFNTKLKEVNDMTELEKALEAQKVELEKSANVELEKALASAKEATDKLEEINKAAAEAKKVEFVELAKSFGAEEDLGVAMVVVAATEQGALVIKALTDAHKRLEDVVEKEAGFTGEAKDGDADTSIMKAMKNKYETK